MNSKAYQRNLPVPFFSQRENTYVWKQIDKTTGFIIEDKPGISMAKQSCNITCLAMILHYFGVTDDSPDKMMRMVFSPTDDEKKTYTKEQLYLVEETYGTKGDEFFEPIEPLRDCRRPQSLRGYGHGQRNTVFFRGKRAGGSAGI